MYIITSRSSAPSGAYSMAYRCSWRPAIGTGSGTTLISSRSIHHAGCIVFLFSFFFFLAKKTHCKKSTPSSSSPCMHCVPAAASTTMRRQGCGTCSGSLGWRRAHVDASTRGDAVRGRTARCVSVAMFMCSRSYLSNNSSLAFLLLPG